MENSPAKYDSHRIRDVDQLDELLVDWRIDSQQLQRGEVEIFNEQVAFNGLTIERTRQNIAKSDFYQVPANTTVISLVQKRGTAANWCGYEVGDDVMVVSQPEPEHFVMLPAGCDHISIWLSNELVTGWDLLPQTLVDGMKISNRSLIPLVNREGERFRKWLFSRFSSRWRLPEFGGKLQDASSIREDFLASLSRVLDRGVEVQTGRSAARRSTKRFETVRRACALIDERIAEHISTNDMAIELGVNLRTLQRGFADVFGLTPHRFIQLRKLRAARRELRNPTSRNSSVSLAAIKYGFTELGRFSVLYQQTFGERPSETLKTHRKSVARVHRT